MTKSQNLLTAYLPCLVNVVCELPLTIADVMLCTRIHDNMKLRNMQLEYTIAYQIPLLYIVHHGPIRVVDKLLAPKTPLLTQALNTISTKQCSEPIYCIVASTILHISCWIGYALALSCSPKHHQENGVTIKTWIKTGKKCLRKMEGK